MGTDRDPGDHHHEHPPTASPAAPADTTVGSSAPRDPKMQAARVRLPDGVYKEFEVNRSSEGEALFQQVTRDLSIEEREYFSLCFYDNEYGTRHWLYNDKKILRQLKGLPWDFSFEVKFYPSTPTTLIDDHARYYVFLQLRRDLITGRLPATSDTHALLGSFVAQMEFGDAPSQLADDYEQFIVGARLVPNSHATPEVFAKIAELHKELRGQSTSEAEILFLDNCRHLALYGIHLFKASDKDKKEVDIGVGSAGINIYQDQSTIHNFLWQNIVKIGFKRSYFSVKLKAGIVGKEEKTIYYKLPSHLSAKRAWKCAVEHHTFFRLIQPEDRPAKSLFSFGSQRFRYQGRTQFQTKMASQMFDRPTQVDRAPSSMSQPIGTSNEQDTTLHTLNLTDSEVEQRNFERYRRALTPKSYTRDEESTISSAAFVKYTTRQSAQLVVSTDLAYSPNPDDSNLSSAAYYMSERSSLRTPSSAYYPPSESSAMQSPLGDWQEGSVQLRSSGGARRNLFGRASERDSVRLVSLHSPVDPTVPIPETRPVRELPEIPIERIVHIYHEGHYDHLQPADPARPAGFGVYTPRNGVSRVDRLEPDGEMDQQPIRYFVDVRHSGASRRDPTKRLSHPGKEDVKERIDLKDYTFAPVPADEPLHRTELTRDVAPSNIQQYARRYHAGDSSNSSNATPPYRLVVSHRPSRNEASNLNAHISQREQVISTKVRRESPDADRRLRLSASVDRSGNVTETTEVAQSTEERGRKKERFGFFKKTTSSSSATSTSQISQVDNLQRNSELDNSPLEQQNPIPAYSPKTEAYEPSSTGPEAYGFPSTSFNGPHDEISLEKDLHHLPLSDYSAYYHHGESWRKEKKKVKVKKEPETKEVRLIARVRTEPEVEPAAEVKQKKTKKIPAFGFYKKGAKTTTKTVKTVESPEFDRSRHEGEEDVVEQPAGYTIDPTAYVGDLEDTYLQQQLEQTPISDHSATYHHGESWRVEKPVTPVVVVEKKQKKEKKVKVPEPEESETKEVRLIARVRTEPEAEPAAEVEKKTKSKLPSFSFSKKTTKTSKTSGYPETSDVFTGELDSTPRSPDLENAPFEHGEYPEYAAKKIETVEDPTAEVASPEKRRYGFFARFRHEGDEDIVEKPAFYAFEPTAYEGPLEDTHLQQELDHSPLSDHSTVYHHGESWRIEKPVTPVVTLEKKQKKVKSPKKEKAPEPEEPETKEVRLIARVRTEPEVEPAADVESSQDKTSKSKRPSFSFFKKTTKTVKTTGYPESDVFTGELDTTPRSPDLDNSPFDHGEYPAYSPKKLETVESPKVEEVEYVPEKKRFGFFARFRHEGEEDVVEKPSAYAFEPTAYEGPLEDTHLQQELDHSPLSDHSTTYHHGESWRVEKPAAPVVVVEKKQKKVKSPKKEKLPEPEESETKEVRLIARVQSAPEEEPTHTNDSKSRLPSFILFKKTTKTVKTSEYPASSETFTGELNTTLRSPDLENAPFEHGEYPEYSAKKRETVEAPMAEDVQPAPEKKLFGFFARFRHEGEEDIVEKPSAYAFEPTAYGGPLEDTHLQKELDQTPLSDHSTVYHHGESWRVEKPATPVVVVEKKQKKVKSPKKEKLPEPEEPENKEVRLIARVRTEPEVEPAADVEKKTSKDSKVKLPSFGFFKKTTKASKTSGYPETSDAFTGELDTTLRSEDLENSPFEHGEYPEYSAKKLETVEAPTAEESATSEKKRFGFFARFRHEGEEDVVEKPSAYSFEPTAYQGPLEDTYLQQELDHSPLSDHSTAYHHGESWRVEKPVTPVVTLEKKQKKVKSPKKEKVPEPVEPETKEVRLIARVRTEPEAEPTAEVQTPKESKSKRPSFSFFKKTTKTTKTSGYPETSDTYTGELDTTVRSDDLESTSFDHGNYPAYSPKKLETEESPRTEEVAAVPEKKRYRLIARFRHDGDEEIIEKPSPYDFKPVVYDGPLEDTYLQQELDHSPLADHSTVYHHGESWRVEKPVTPVVTLEKKQKKVKSPKKEKLPEPEEPETKEIRLIARVRSEPEAEPAAEVKEKTTKESKAKLPSFGFFKKTTKTTKASGYPETTEAFTGELDTTLRSPDLENAPFEHGEYPEYSAKKLEAVESPTAEEVVDVSEKKRHGFFARFRHEGDEDVVEKPEYYAFEPTAYDGPLEDTHLQQELDHSPLSDHSSAYHHGESWRVEKPVTSVATLEKKQKKVKSPKKEKVPVAEEPETKEVRLIARVRSEPEDESTTEVPKTTPVKDESKSKRPSFGFFKKTTKTSKISGYPTSSEAFIGELDTTLRSEDLENSPFEHGEYPAYSPKKLETVEAPTEEVVSEVAAPENRLYRLIARFRHEGEEDVVEKPDGYTIDSTAYEGPLEDTHLQQELDHTPLADHSTAYHHGESWRVKKPATPVATLEKKQKKAKSPKKEKVPVSEEPETKEVRLIARVRSEPEADPAAEVKKKTPKESKSKLPSFSFSKKTTKTTKTSGYPETSDAFTGELDSTPRSPDLENAPFDHEEYPAYSPKKFETVESPKPEEVAVPEKKRVGFFARFRHEGEEVVVEKPSAYSFEPTAYEGPLENTHLQQELEHSPLADHSSAYHHGESWRVEKPTAPVVVDEKKQKKVKSPNKEKVPEPVEPETKEIRLIARVRTEPEAEPTDDVQKKTPNDSKIKLPSFGFFKKATKTTKTSGYPETSDAYTGELDTTVRSPDLENSPFDHGEYPEYSAKKIETVDSPAAEESATSEKKRFGFFARFRHEGEEDVVEKPGEYDFKPVVYEGPLEDTHLQQELDQTPLSDHSTAYHHGESWRIEKPVTPVVDVEKKQKKVKSPKKEKLPESEKPETKEIRLIARVRTDPEDEQTAETTSKKATKTDDSKVKRPSLSFFKKIPKTTKTSGYPESEAFTGELDTTLRSPDLENSPFEHGEYPEYSAKKIENVEAPITEDVQPAPEKKRFGFFARFRHEGEEDVVEKPSAYAFEPTAYDGPLENTYLQQELDHSPLSDHSTAYHHGESWRIEMPATPVVTLEKKQKKVKSPKKEKTPEPEEPETKEIRLIARVRSEPEEEQTSGDEDPKTKRSSFHFFKKTTKTTKPSGYPETTEAFTGDLDTTLRSEDVETSPFEHGEYPAYSPKQLESPRAEEVAAVPEKKRFGFFARFRHEGEEDIVEKPSEYTIDPTAYEGPLEDTHLQKELDHTPLSEYSAQYHHGESWRVEKPVTPVVTLEKKQKKVKSPKKEKVKVPEPEEPETKKVRLIARVRTEPEVEPSAEVQENTTKDTKSKRLSFGFFKKSTKTSNTSEYPATSEAFTGELDTTLRSPDLDNAPFEHGEYPEYSVKKLEIVESPKVEEVPVPEKKRYGFFARFRHEGDEDVVEKPSAYTFEPTVYEGPLEDTHLQQELDHSPLSDHSTVYHHGESWRIEKPVTPVVAVEKKQKKEKKVKSPKKEKLPEPVEPETKEVRLIARVRTEPEAEPTVEVEKKTAASGDSKSKLPTFGFFKKSTKTSKTFGYPETSDAFTGELDTTIRSEDLETSPFEHGEYPEYSAKKIETVESPAAEESTSSEKKRFGFFARFRHEGEEDVVEKPSEYIFEPTVYEGPLDDTHLQHELDHSPLSDHSSAYHHGESWRIEKPATPVATLEKKQKKVKSPKKEKVPVVEEPETKEVRLIARVRTEPEDEATAEVPNETAGAETSKAKRLSFGFFKKTTKTSKTSGYPESEAFTGELDTTLRSPDLENAPFEHGEYPEYSAKKIETVESPETEDVKAVPEKKRFGFFARFRHEGEEDVVEKPSAYAFEPSAYEGPLEDTHLQQEIDHSPLSDHSTAYHHGESWRVEMPATPVATLEKKQKKAKSPKKEKTPEPVEPETKEVRLIARVRTEPEVEPTAEVQEKTPKNKDSKSKLPSFGFFKKTTKTSKTSGYPETSDAFTGDLDTTLRSPDLENSPFEHGEYPEYSAKKLETVEAPKAEDVQPAPEKKRFGFFARFRHEGEEDVVENPSEYIFEPTVYEGPLEDTHLQQELDHSPLSDHSTAYHHGESWRIEKPATPVVTLEKKQKKVKSPKKEKLPEPEEPETKEIRLIARVRTEPEAETSAEVQEKTAGIEDSKAKRLSFNFFKRTTKASKTAGYPETSKAFTGELDTTLRSPDLENSPFEHGEYPEYSAKKLETAEASKAEDVQPVPEKKRFGFFARFRHEGDEDVVEKPPAYSFEPTVYEGPLEDTHLQHELDHSPLSDHSTAYHHGESWRIEKPATPVVTLEKKQKKVKSPKKEKLPESEEPETKEVKLIARVKSEPEDVPAAETEKTTAKRPSFLFFKKTTKTSKTSGYPESEAFTGEYDTTLRSPEFETSSFDHGEYPAYSPKKREAVESPKSEDEKPEKKRYGFFARFRHEGEEDVVEKPSAYTIDSIAYDGPLEDTHLQKELDQTPLSDHSSAYHHGESWRVEKPVVEKKQKKAKSPEPEEPETKEVRLIAKLHSEAEAEPTAEEEYPKAKRTSFNFFKKTTKTTKTSGYPETTVFTGELDTTLRSPDLETSAFEHGEWPEYSPKKVDTVESPKAEEAEKKRIGFFARFRHEGVEDVVEKPSAYIIDSAAYEGPLEDTHLQKELDHAQLSDHSSAYHHGESWRVEKKKAKSPKREEPEPEIKDVKLIARVQSEPEEEDEDQKTKRLSFSFFKKTTKTAKTSDDGDEDIIYTMDPTAYEGPLEDTHLQKELDQTPLSDHSSPYHHGESWRTSPKKVARIPPVQRDLRLRLFNKKPPSAEYPETSPVYEGRLDVTSRSDDLEPMPYLHGEVPTYSPKVTPRVEQKMEEEKENETVQQAKTSRFRFLRSSKSPAKPEPLPLEVQPARTIPKTEAGRKYRLIARIKHAGAEDEVDAARLHPVFYPKSAPYSGRLEALSRGAEVEETPVRHFAQVYHSGSSGRLRLKLGKKIAEKPDAKLVARVLPLQSEDESEDQAGTTIGYLPSSLSAQHYNPRPARIEGYTDQGLGYVEVRLETRAEVQLEPVYELVLPAGTRHAPHLSTASASFGGGIVVEDEQGLRFSSTPPLVHQMAPPERPSILARLGFKKSHKKKTSETAGAASDSEHDEKQREFAVVEFEPQCSEEGPKTTTTKKGPPKKPEHLNEKTPRGRRSDEPMNEVTVLVTNERPAELGATREVRHETREQQFRLTGDGYTSGFNPNEPSLMATIQRAERLNASSPRLEHAERTFTVRANAPLPVSFEESGQPYTTVSTWQETSDLPEHVEVYTDENGRQITRTIKSSQVKHTVQTQSFQNYIVDGDQVPIGVVDVERSREQLTPIGGANGANGGATDEAIVETQTRTMTYEAQGAAGSSAESQQVAAAPPGWAEEGLGEYVSSKSVTQGNRTIETITYKTEKDGVVETHVEHRVTIHSDGDIDHDAELSQAILEATQMNPDMVVEKIEVRQETTQ